ncbi:MAG: hypothetical protein ACK41C_16685 [Phenylobacterium sp.]|uniref:hypothetical protein n=1 Tax=Phenylobacterium sp. TaxID=1871053 RepID=UPI00391CFD0B
MSSLVASVFLRRVLALDAVATAATGALLATAAQPLEGLMGLPADMSRPVGLFLIAYAFLPGAMAALRVVPAPAVWAVIGINTVWSLESVGSLALGWVSPNALGTAFVIAQAAAVGGFAALQYLGLRRSTRFA